MIEKIFHFATMPHFVVLVTSWLGALVLLPLVIAAARRFRLMDRPHSYKSHTVPVPNLGGIVIFLAIAMSLLTTLRLVAPRGELPANVRDIAYLMHNTPWRPFAAMLTGGFVMLIMGLVDDFRPISAVSKLGVITVLAILLSFAKVSLTTTGVVQIDFVLTVLWIAGVTSAVNSLDHMDGLSGGASAIGCALTFVFAWYTIEQVWLSLLAIALLGASLGFLQYNFRPARIYLGNNGALFLGFMLASMTAFGGWSSDRDVLRAITIPCLILSIPLFDITLTTLLRYQSGTVSTLRQAIVFCGRDHTGHRLVARGWGVRRAALFLYLGGAFCGMPALVAHGLTTPQYLATLAAVAVWLLLLGVALHRAPLDMHVVARTASLGTPPDEVPTPPLPVPQKSPGQEPGQGQGGAEPVQPPVQGFPHTRLGENGRRIH